MQRTQIYLPEDLRKDIDNLRSANKESLAEYIRKATEERVIRQKNKKADLKKLAKELGGSVDPKKSGWAGMSKKDIIAWQRRIRKDRKIL